MHMTATCECGTAFARTSPHRRFCTERCRKRAEHRRRHAQSTEHATCQHCDAGFERSTTSGRRKVYCSLACHADAKRWVYAKTLSVPIPWARCSTCDAQFISKHNARQCTACRIPRAVRWIAGSCRRCGDAFVVGPGRGRAFTRYCSRRCGLAAKADRHEARKRAARVEDVWRSKVYARDGWTCQLCHEPVDRDVISPDPWAASLDHIVPLALGGEHSYANVQLAHLWCNSVKGARPEDAEWLKPIGGGGQKSTSFGTVAGAVSPNVRVLANCEAVA